MPQEEKTGTVVLERDEGVAGRSHSFAPFVSVEGLSVKTPMGSVYENVNFRLEKGTVACIFGNQGSGKTSLLLTMSGRMKPSAGDAKVGEYRLTKDFRRIRRMSAISFIPGINDVQPFLQLKRIAAAELALVGKRGNKANTDAFLKDWGYYEKRDVHFNDLNSYESTVFGIMLAMAGKPELLLVDDVQADLTQYESKKVVALLHDTAESFGTTVLFGCTEYEIARNADGLVIMSEEAASQRRAVLRDENLSVADAKPVFGYGNDVTPEDSVDSQKGGER
ncbi:MAG: ATP-binding cassette domain-containing protein [Coriobacteriales bacterium]|jgi:ABC-2 type transport system ATP-binding protein